MDKRIKWIDYMGGFAMLLVFIQHSKMPLITRVILAFHMPLFFWISGFLYAEKQEENVSIKDFLKKRFMRLIVPWIFWVFIDYMITAIQEIISADFEFLPFIVKLFTDIIYGTSFWFLPCMFVADILFHLSYKIMHHIKSSAPSEIQLLLGALLFWGLSWIENQSVSIILPFRIDVSLMATGFLFLGAGMHNVIQIIKHKGGLVKVSLFLTLTVLSLICIVLNGRDGSNFMMYMNEYGNYLYAIAGAGSLIICTIIFLDISQPLLPKKYLFYLRRNSLILFPIHMLILRMVQILYPQINTYNLWVQSVINLVLIHIFMIPVCWVINQYLPIFAGKGNKLKSTSLI